MPKTPPSPPSASHGSETHDPVGHDADTPLYDGAVGGWGSLKGVTRIFGEIGGSATALRILAGQNKPRGMMCTSCAWAKPAKPHTFEFCENGAKATLWELDSGAASAVTSSRSTRWPSCADGTTTT